MGVLRIRVQRQTEKLHFSYLAMAAIFARLLSPLFLWQLNSEEAKLMRNDRLRAGEGEAGGSR